MFTYEQPNRINFEYYIGYINSSFIKWDPEKSKNVFTNNNIFFILNMELFLNIFKYYEMGWRKKEECFHMSNQIFFILNIGLFISSSFIKWDPERQECFHTIISYQNLNIKLFLSMLPQKVAIFETTTETTNKLIYAFKCVDITSERKAFQNGSILCFQQNGNIYAVSTTWQLSKLQ